jgi:hypothetical protein
MKSPIAIAAFSLCILGAGCSGAPTESSASSASAISAGTQADVQARAAWRAAISVNPSASDGCFHASYPSMTWESVDCVAAPARPFFRSTAQIAPETVGNGNDFGALVSGGVITSAVGSFPSVTGVTSENDEGSANTYSIQLNSNFMTKARCHTIPGCMAWQQFVYSSSEQSAFMQYWLINQGTCPQSDLGEWIDAGNGACFKNSNAVSVPQLDISNLSTMSMSASAVLGGNNVLVFSADGQAFSTSGRDAVVELEKDWNGAEFNIIGDGGGSEATFNAGSSITVNLALTNGSTAAPQCLSNDGTTGETNNLNLGSCNTGGGTTPFIQFTESL